MSKANTPAKAKTPAADDKAPEQSKAPDQAEKKSGAKAKTLPDSVTLRAPHGFIDDDGQHRYWQPGQVVTDPEQIALLHERKAPLEGVEYEGQ